MSATSQLKAEFSSDNTTSPEGWITYNGYFHTTKVSNSTKKTGHCLFSFCKRYGQVYVEGTTVLNFPSQLPDMVFIALLEFIYL
jgi:hypothetical protein